MSRLIHYYKNRSWRKVTYLVCLVLTQLGRRTFSHTDEAGVYCAHEWRH